jgi:hypothetical protein
MASNPTSEVEKTKRLVQQAAVRVQVGRKLAEQTWEAIRRSRDLLQRTERVLQALGSRRT